MIDSRTCAVSQRQLHDEWIEMRYPTRAYQTVNHRQRLCLRAKVLKPFQTLVHLLRVGLLNLKNTRSLKEVLTASFISAQ